MKLFSSLDKIGILSSNFYKIIRTISRYLSKYLKYKGGFFILKNGLGLKIMVF